MRLAVFGHTLPTFKATPSRTVGGAQRALDK